MADKKTDFESTTTLEDGGYTSASASAKPNAFTYLAIFTAMMGAMMFGLDQANFGGVQNFPDFLEYWCVEHYGTPLTCNLATPAECDAFFATNATECAGTTNGADCCTEMYLNNHDWHETFVTWGATLITLGAAAGALFLAPYLTSGLGRRICIFTGAALCIVGCFLASYMSFGIPAIFLVGRFLTGFGVGVCCFALPMYNSEIATPSIRGATGSLFQFNVVIGGFIATMITMFFKSWHFGILLPCIPGIIICIVIWFVPESPRYVMAKQGYDEGVVILNKIRSGDVTPEAQEIYEQLKAEDEAGSISYPELFKEPSLRLRVFVACFLQVAQQLTGVNAFLSYASNIFAGIGISDPFQFNVIWNFVMVIGVTVGLFLLDSKFGGRRIQLLGATCIMGPPLIIAGLAFSFGWDGIITMIMLCLYGLGFQLAWGAIPWIYPSEIFNMAEKDKAMSLAVTMQYGINAVIAYTTPLMYSWSMAGTMYVFGGLNCANFFFVWFLIKETKGVPLEEIPALFGAKVGSRSYA